MSSSVTENPSFALEVQGLIYITNDVEIKISLEGSKAMVTPASVTGKPCKLFLLSEFEVFGGRSYANSAEQNYQQQYAYFKAGNSKIANHHTAVTTAVWWWLRSPYYNGSNYFCSVTGNGAYSNNFASYSGGLRAGFCVSAA